MRLPSYLIKSRHGIYYLRLRRNGKEQRRSLGTRDPNAAIHAAWAFGAKINSNMSFNNLKGWTLRAPGIEIETDGTAEDHARAREVLADVLASLHITQPHQQTLVVKNPCTIGQAVSDYLEERKHDWVISTHIDYTGILAKLSKCFGETTPLHTISKDNFVAYRQNNLDSKHPKTSSKAISCIEGLETWAKNRGRINDGFVVRRELSKSVRAKLVIERGKNRLPLNANDLHIVLDANRIQTADKPHLFWLPLLSIYTGARIGELSQVRLCDITQDANGQIILDITPDAGRLKNRQSERKIPLHPVLKLAGLADYIEDVKRCWPAAERIFPYLIPDPRNGHANRPGKDFSRHWGPLLKQRSKSFHSLRHTFISCLAKCKADPDFARVYVGHASGRGDVHDNDYNHAVPFLNEHLEMLALLDFKRWPEWAAPKYLYQAGQFDDFFSEAIKTKIKTSARKNRVLSSPKSKLEK